jgi:hypothetical protein
MADQNAPYEVGYGKPPRKNRFVKGGSGNPKGRPRGAKNLATIVLKESRQTVLVNGPHGSRKVTKIEAAMMQLGNKSAQGDLRATREFVALIERSEESAMSGASGIPLNELDLKTLEGLRRRISIFSTEPTKTEEEKSE